ncbi:MAG: aromatic amino acid lyase, partial [Egibacteraceae bacterium]
MSEASVRLHGTRLTCDQVAAVARAGAPVTVAAAAMERARAAARVVREVAARRPVYGRTTGVGANRSAQVDSDDGTHGLH